MPELPDVEIFRQYLVATSLHKAILGVEILAKRELKTISGKALADSLRNRSIKSAQRHGKHLLAELDNGNHLTMHFGMTGFLRYHKQPGDAPEHTCLKLKLANGYYLSYSCTRHLGRLGLIRNKARFISALKLGSDALALGRRGFLNLMDKRRGQIKAALMDQSLIAGIGNVYSDEILFQSRLHPRLAVKAIKRDKAANLHKTMQRVLTTAMERRAEPAKMPRSWILPRRGRPVKCPSGCGGTLRNIRAAGRSAWICPVCQQGPQDKR